MISIALFTTLLLSNISHAAPGVNHTLSFGGRLMDSSGGVVPDGYYNLQFKIYQDGTGTTAGNPGGTLKWNESYINNGGTNGVQVTNGFFSVNLGSIVPFGSSVDWNQDTLWLSMNVAGSSSSCTTFNRSPCAADGEMVPMKRITATPYALNAGAVGGKTADNFLQLAQGVQTDVSMNTSSIFVNKTGTGNLIRLQTGGNNAFSVTNAGNIEFGSGASRAIYIGSAGTNTSGDNLVVHAGYGGDGTGSNGGGLFLQGGSAGGTNADGGSISITGGTGAGTGKSGSVYIGASDTDAVQIGSNYLTSGTQAINIGTNNTAGGTTNITIGTGGSATGGTTALQSKNDTTITTDGITRARFSGSSSTLYVGNADTSGQATTANGFTVQGTSSTGNNTQGGSLSVQSGSATNGNANGGNLTLSGGAGAGTGAAGLVVINTPTFQTASQQVCATNCTITQANLDSNGVLTLSASAANLTMTMNNPTIPTAGRIIYMTAASGSSDFKLAINGGGTGNLVTMRHSTTATLLWNGTAWTVAGASNATTLQDVYNNTLQSTGAAGLALGDGSTSSSLIIRDTSTNPLNGALLQVQNTAANTVFSVNSLTNGSSNVQIGTGTGAGSPTLLTLDKAGTAPTVSGNAMLGSMYYDTTLGELQCFEASGWGACSASPDDFVTISPQYSNAVTHSTGIGTMTSDLCSDALNINNGSSSQPTICGTNETYNYYDWTSSELTAQTRSIYVTYQLSSSFKGFVPGSTSLIGRTDSANSAVTYQIYRNNTTSGLTACGSAVSVSTGIKTTWQKASATNSSDPSTCSFVAGDSIVFRVNLAASNTANAYASTLGFAFTNN